MPKFAANLTMMFNEIPFMDRFKAAADAGFTGVEYLFPYDFSPEEIAGKLKEYGLTQALFNLPPGHWENGDRGMAAIPGREDEFKKSVEQAITYASKLSCKHVHAMSGLVQQTDQSRATFVANIKYACDALAPHGITLLIEPINARDMPGYFMNNTSLARDIIKEVGASNLALQLDLYHCQITEGDLAVHIKDLKDITRHIQIAGVPERHEPDIGEINFPYLFELLDSIGYDGWIGCEYRPKNETTSGLGWMNS